MQEDFWLLKCEDRTLLPELFVGSKDRNNDGTLQPGTHLASRASDPELINIQLQRLVGVRGVVAFEVKLYLVRRLIESHLLNSVGCQQPFDFSEGLGSEVLVRISNRSFERFSPCEF